MSYNSKYTGKQVDDLLDQVEYLSNIDLSEYVTKAELDLAISEAITTTLNTEV